MTPLFDRYAIVDWSASNTPTTGKDSIWIAFAEREGAETRLLETANPSTRSAAMAMLRQFFRDSLAENKRVFAGFDFPFGYPAGAAAVIAGTPDWRALWHFLAEAMQDRDDNFSNRFEVTGRLNREALAFAPMYWGRPMHQEVPGLPVARPEPYPTALPEKRLAEQRTAKAQPVWKLAFAGSVGSQAITGIARLEHLRRDPEFAEHVSVWPFETRFADDLGAPIVLAEIYPSLAAIEKGEKSCLDEAQVEGLADIFARFDAEGRFGELLAAPADLSEAERGSVLTEEGWIAGLGHRLAETATRRAGRLCRAGLAARLSARSGGDLCRELPADPRRDRPVEPAGERPRPRHPADPCLRHARHRLRPRPVGGRDRGRPRRARPGRADPLRRRDGVPRHHLVAAAAAEQDRLPAERAAHAPHRRARRHDPLGGAGRSVERRHGRRHRRHRQCADGAVPPLERIDEGAARPALIVGLPVGFVGAAESKAELVRDPRGIPFVTLTGRRGGSAMAAAAVNALAQGLE